VQIQIYDYFLEKRPKDFIEKSIAPVSHSGRGFIASKFQGLFNRIHGACLKPSKWDPRGLFGVTIRKPVFASSSYPELYFPFKVIALFADNIFSKRNHLSFYIPLLALGSCQALRGLLFPRTSPNSRPLSSSYGYLLCICNPNSPFRTCDIISEEMPFSG
jgi:hypothetical protein